MAWTAQEDGRWSMEDSDRHLLLKAGSRYVELHGTTVHVYEGPDEVAEPEWPLGNPFTADPDAPIATHVLTEEDEYLEFTPDDEVWTVLAGDKYTKEADDGVDSGAVPGGAAGRVQRSQPEPRQGR